VAKGDNIQARLLDLSVSISELCDRLPKTGTGRHVSDQLMRSGTSPSSNYAEACAAESRKDFVHKLGIVFKELKETLNWLQVVSRRGLAPEKQIGPLLQETEEMCRIIAVSIRTLRNGKV